jgi:hypothetical protein
VLTLIGRLVAVVLGVFVVEMALQAVMTPRVERRYGFELGSPYVKVGPDEEEEVRVFERVDSGGAFARAGVTEGDILGGMLSKGLLYLYLSLLSPGDSTRVTILPGGDGPPIRKRPKRRVTVVAP